MKWISFHKNNRYKALYVALMLYAVSLCGVAQNNEQVYKFLRFPSSARVNALGGSNVSLVDNDASLVFQNPSLLGTEMDKRLAVSYLSYVADISLGSGVFAKKLSPISAGAVGVNYVNYGNFAGADADGNSTGSFDAKDIAINAFYSRDLTEKLRAGVTAKYLYSNYEEYTSSAIGFDVGISYFIEDKDFTFAVVAKNIGAQLSAYNSERLSLPWDLQIGFTRRLSHAPLRISVTAQMLNQWHFDHINKANAITDESQAFLPTLIKHLVLGVELLPSENFWVGIGFNPKTNSDLKLLNGNKWGGLSLGAGLKAKRFNIGASMSRYQASSTAYMLSLGIDLDGQ